jgi:hypothetical protein
MLPPPVMAANKLKSSNPERREFATMVEKDPKSILTSPLRVINVGLTRFAEDLASQDVEVVQVDWSPPAGGDPKLADLLSKLGN